MAGIRAREGLTGGADGPPGEGPADYRALRAERDVLYRSVYDTVFTSVPRRHRRDDVAALYEDDREAFAALSGCRMLFPNLTPEDGSRPSPPVNGSGG